MKNIFTLVSIFSFFVTIQLKPQSTNFNLQNYKSFLESNGNLSSGQLLEMYNAGEFQKRVSEFNDNALYLDSVEIKYKLTDDELTLLRQNGFVVTERINYVDFTHMFLEIYHKDLPVYISSDAILNAFHKSYDLILKGVEIRYLIPKLREILNNMQNSFHLLGDKYLNNTDIQQMLRDADIYISVPAKLLDVNSQLYYEENTAYLNSLLNKIENLEPLEEPFFSDVPRKYDYSQFKVRGHYTDENFPELTAYFKAMIWLGRTELYLIAPVSGEINKPSSKDIQRQIIISRLLSELIEISNSRSTFDEFEKVISSFVGEQDNVTLPQINSVFEAVGISNALPLLDTNKVKEFQDTLITKPYSSQKILSQLLMSDPYSPDAIEPASAFLLFGQRFVIDSYITNNVTFDRINYEGVKITRMLPQMLDMLFALGNSSAAQLLVDELNNYHYSSNLASLKYLVDSYSEDFWHSSIYNSWLNSIRSLNPPVDRSTFPQFMQTAAWWQKTLNTQAASWTELRHDNILYAKQSYSGIVVCSYPYGYVEPVPQFYNSLKILSQKTIDKFSNLSLNLEREIDHFNYFINCMDTLESIANKELNQVEFSDEEKIFLQHVVFDTPGCGGPISGWYYRLIYKDYTIGENSFNDNIVADYHTSASDEFGSIVGWVKHAGTGDRNLCIINTFLPGVGDVAFVGPVSSYYEYTTTNFKRLSDEEWQDEYLNESFRPSWVNSYLADKEGNMKPVGAMLFTEVKDKYGEKKRINDFHIIAQNYPNPFNAETIINFTIPAGLEASFVEINIYNIQGEFINKIFSGNIQPGNYLTKWNGKNSALQNVSSGIYFYEIKCGNHKTVGKMNLLK